MRLYSRRELLATAGVAVLVGTAAGLAIGYASFSAPHAVAGPSGWEAAAVAGAAEADPTDPAPATTRDLSGEGVRPVPARDAPRGSGNARLAFDATDEANNIAIYQRFNAAVVNVTAVAMEYDWFLDVLPRSGAGSGSIIDRAGHVLTNYHVIKDARRVSVTLASGDEREGEVIGIDPENDLAVVKFDPRGLQFTTIPLGRSSDLMVGQKVLAIGNPFALSRTLTTGVVSGLGRPVSAENGSIIQEMIQTDASINPGNSGGPLLNSRGEMIGINTTILESPSGGAVGIGFAVPVDTARRVLPEMMRYGEVRRGWIEVRPVQLFPRLVRQLRLPVARGILVSEVIPGGNAAAAGIRGGNRTLRWGRSLFRVGGDIIIEVDGTPTARIADLFKALEDNKPGERVAVVYLRGTRRMETTIRLNERPPQVRGYFS